MIIASFMVVEIISLILKNGGFKQQKPYLNKVTPYDSSIQNLNANLMAQFDNNNNLSDILTDFGIYDTTFNLNPEFDYGKVNEINSDTKLTGLPYGNIKQLNATSESNTPVSIDPDSKITDTTINLNPEFDYGNVNEINSDTKLTGLPYGDIKQLNATSENNTPVSIDPDSKITDTTINLDPQTDSTNVTINLDTKLTDLPYDHIKQLNATSENNTPVLIDPDRKITDTTINLNPQTDSTNVTMNLDTKLTGLPYGDIKQLNATSENNTPVLIRADTRITDTTINLNPQIDYGKVNPIDSDTKLTGLLFKSLKDLNVVSENNEPVSIDPDSKITDTTINLNAQNNYGNMNTNLNLDTNIKSLSFNSLKYLNAVSESNLPTVIDSYTYVKTTIDYINKIDTTIRNIEGTTDVGG
jgi:hypothetical protein